MRNVYFLGNLIGEMMAESRQIHKVDKNDLKEGFRLEPVELPEDANEHDRKLEYSHLYKDGKKVSDKVFRRGGLGSGKFKDGFAQLLYYPNFGTKDNSSFGTHVILNKEGKIVLEADKFDHLYHLKGCIAKVKDKYYNLNTGELIAKGSSSVSSTDYLFVEHRWDYDKENPMQTGVYQIEYKTGKVTLFTGVK